MATSCAVSLRPRPVAVASSFGTSEQSSRYHRISSLLRPSSTGFAFRSTGISSRRFCLQYGTMCAASNAAKRHRAPKPKSATQVKDILLKDFKQNRYLVTGNLTEDLYTKNCKISDPTRVIWGVQLYRAIIARIFDAERSSIKLKQIKVTGPSSIEAVWSKDGFLKLPWTPYLTTQEGKTIYTLNEAGLICDHKQIWTNMTALQGIKLALTPCKRPD